jgi:prepilin-type N-terminal cleavage/methylation domain-containing protein
MMFCSLKQINNNHKGFTLIELVVALAIAGILGGGVTMAISQIFTDNSRSTSHMIAVKEVENAVHWITNDAQVVQVVNTGHTADGFPLHFNWVEWNGDSHTAVYQIANGRLTRSYSVNGENFVNTVVVEHLDSDLTFYTPTTTTLGFTITSTIIAGSLRESETRSFNINPRCAPISISPIPTLVITTGSLLPDGYEGVAYSETLIATGGTAPYTWTMISGALPTGLQLSGNTISGTPPTGSAGTYTFTIQVTDNDMTTPQMTTDLLSIYIRSALSITTATMPDGQVGAGYSQTLTANGGMTPYTTWAIIAGSLPTGLSINTSTGVISGTPTAAGTFNFTIRVTDSASHTATKALSIYIGFTISPTSLPNGVVNAAYSQTLTASGGTTPYTWSRTGSLPTGLSLNTSTGVISGTPTATGTFSFTISVTDSAAPTNNTATQDFTVTIYNNLTITSTSPLPDGYRNSAYSQTLTASGGTGSYTWVRTSGSLPTGLSFSSDGVISGTPTTANTYNFTIRVTDGASHTATASFTLTIDDTLTITTTSLSDGRRLRSYSRTLAASGGTTPYTWAVSSGSLPAGLSLNTTTGVISGTITATAVTSNFTIRVTDSASHTATRNLSIRITN